jgi:hypothetical protein
MGIEQKRYVFPCALKDLSVFVEGDRATIFLERLTHDIARTAEQGFHRSTRNDRKYRCGPRGPACRSVLGASPQMQIAKKCMPLDGYRACPAEPSGQRPKGTLFLG